MMQHLGGYTKFDIEKVGFFTPGYTLLLNTPLVENIGYLPLDENKTEDWTKKSEYFVGVHRNMNYIG